MTNVIITITTSMSVNDVNELLKTPSKDAAVIAQGLERFAVEMGSGGVDATFSVEVADELDLVARANITINNNSGLSATAPLTVIGLGEVAQITCGAVQDSPNGTFAIGLTPVESAANMADAINGSAIYHYHLLKAVASGNNVLIYTAVPGKLGNLISIRAVQGVGAGVSIDSTALTDRAYAADYTSARLPTVYTP